MGGGAPHSGPAQQRKLFQIQQQGRAEGVRGWREQSARCGLVARVDRAGEVWVHVPQGKRAKASVWELGPGDLGWLLAPAPCLPTPSPPAVPQRPGTISGFF